VKIGLLIYGSLDTLSGGYYYDRRLVASLRARGDEVRIVSLPWRNYPAHLADNLGVRLPAGLDVLIQDELNHPSLLAANRRPHPYPLVSLVHHLRVSEVHPPILKSFYRLVERLYLRSVDGFIFNSRTTAASVEALLARPRPSALAYPPVDRFGAPVDERQVARRLARGGPLRLIFVGNLIRRKGLHTLVEALAGLPAGGVALEVVGSPLVEPGYVRSLRARLESLGRMPFVRFRGILEERALQDALAEADLLVVPSSYEGYGIVYLEGMAFGLPAIGTTAGAAGEIIENGRNGYLVTPETPAELAGRLAGLLSDRDLLARLSLGALERYRRQPAWETGVDGIRDLLIGLVD
jgi:glycosyltransferase involved in cell wall biosynthesis